MFAASSNRLSGSDKANEKTQIALDGDFALFDVMVRDAYDATIVSSRQVSRRPDPIKAKAVKHTVTVPTIGKMTLAGEEKLASLVESAYASKEAMVTRDTAFARAGGVQAARTSLRQATRTAFMSDRTRGSEARQSI